MSRKVPHDTHYMELLSDFPGTAPLPLPPPPPPIPNPTRQRRRKGKKRLEGDKQFWTEANMHGAATTKPKVPLATTKAPKPTTRITTMPPLRGRVPSPKSNPRPTTTPSATVPLPLQAKRISADLKLTTSSSKEVLQVPRGAKTAAQTSDSQNKQFNRRDLKARVQKLLVVDDNTEDLQPAAAAPKFRAFAMVKKPKDDPSNTKAKEGKSKDEGKLVKGPTKTKPKAKSVRDSSYRPSKLLLEEWASSEFGTADEDEPDLGWGFLPGDLRKSMLTAPAGKASEFGKDGGNDEGKPVKGPKPKWKAEAANIFDPSYRPSRTSLEEWDSSEFNSDDEEESPHLDWGLGSGDRPGFEKSSPPASLEGPSQSLSPRAKQPQRQPPRQLPPPLPRPNPRKRKSAEDSSYWFSSESDKSSWEDEASDSDEEIKALKRPLPGKDKLNGNAKRVKRAKKVTGKSNGKGVEKKTLDKLSEEDMEKSIPPTEEVGDGKPNSTVKKKKKKKKKKKSILDPSYKPPRDEEEDSDEYSEYVSSDGGTTRRRKRIGVRGGYVDLKGKDDSTKEMDDNNRISHDPDEPTAADMDSVKPQHKLPHEICQARPYLPPKFGKVKQPNRHKPPRVYDPSYKPGSTSSDDDSDSFNSSSNSEEDNRRANRKPRKARHRALRPMAQTQTVSEQQRNIIQRMLEGTRPRPRPAPATPTPAQKRPKRSRLFGRQTSDESYRPSGSGSESDEYSGEWDSDEWPSELEFKWKKKRKGGKKSKKQEPSIEIKPQEATAGTGKKYWADWDRARPSAATEATQATAPPGSHVPPPPRKMKRRRAPLDRDGLYLPSTDSDSDLDSEEGEFESGFISELDHSVPIPSISLNKVNFPKPDFLSPPKGDIPASPFTLPSKVFQGQASVPQLRTVSHPLNLANTLGGSLANIKTVFYPLCHGRYTPWPPAPGTIYCRPCFREQVIVRGLLIRQGIAETLRVLKLPLGGGDEFGREMNEALEKVWRGVERKRKKMKMEGEDEGHRRKRRQGHGENEEIEEGGVQRGQMEDTYTNLNPNPVASGQSYLPKLLEDVQTLVVMRRLVDLVNTNTTRDTTRSSLITVHPHGHSSGVSPTMPKPISLLPYPPTAFPKPTSIHHVTGPSRYSSPRNLPPRRLHPALIPQGDAHGRTIATAGTSINRSFFILKPPPTRSTIPAPLPSLHTQNPLDKAINTLHDALGISPWQARRLWKGYEGRQIWEVARVDLLVKRVCRTNANADLNGDQQVMNKVIGADTEKICEGTEEVGVENEDGRVMLEFDVARLEEEINGAFVEAEKGSREEVEGRTRLSDDNGTVNATGDTQSIISSGMTTSQDGRKRPRDDDDFNEVQPPRKKSKLVKPMELLNSKSKTQQSQEALPSPTRIPEGKPRMTIPCHSCSSAGFNAVKYNIPSCAAVRGNDYTERPLVKTLQWALDISESEVARMTPSNLLDFVGQSGRAAHVNNSGWDFLVYQPDGADDDERRIVFLDVGPGLDLHV